MELGHVITEKMLTYFRLVAASHSRIYIASLAGRAPTVGSGEDTSSNGRPEIPLLAKLPPKPTATST